MIPGIPGPEQNVPEIDEDPAECDCDDQVAELNEELRACDVAKTHDQETTRQVQLRAEGNWSVARAKHMEAFIACLHEGHGGRTCDDILGSTP
jgi:hypothetical protein